MKIEKGYIYIMQLSEQKDIVKIGKTSDHPYHRADTLSKNTAAISSFTPYFYLKVLDTTTAERKAHKLFDSIRKDAKKEYFKLKNLEQLNLMIAKLILHFGKNSDLVDHEDSEGVYWKGYKLIPYKEAVEIASSIFIVKEIHAFEIALKYATDEEQFEKVKKAKIKAENQLKRLKKLDIGNSDAEKSKLIKRIKGLEELLEDEDDKSKPVIDRIIQLKSELKSKFNVAI